MKKILLPTFLLVLMAFSGSAQQDPMFTKYMFNSLVFNPAYAGAKDHMSVTLLHRDQWWGIEGAPKTQSFTIHSPLEGDRVGLGLSVIRDEIGPTKTLSAMASYAYRIPLGQGKLALGVQAGAMNYRTDLSDLSIENASDPVFMNSLIPNMWLPNFGAGVHYYVPNKFYVGASSPNILQSTLRDNVGVPEIDSMMASRFRHYYLFAGGAIRLNSLMVFKPSFLVK